MNALSPLFDEKEQKKERKTHKEQPFCCAAGTTHARTQGLSAPRMALAEGLAAAPVALAVLFALFD